jgi:hypothetical protein
MPSPFYLPDGDNEITQTDLDNGRLRITAKAATMFPSRSQKVIVKAGSITREVNFKKSGTGGSSILSMTNAIFAALDFKRGNRLRIVREAPDIFVFEKV